MLSLKLSAFDEAYDWLCKFQSLWNNPLNSSTPSSSKSADNLSLHRFFASAFSTSMRTSKFQSCVDDFEAKIEQGNRTRLQIEVIKEIPIQGSQQLQCSKIKV